MANNDFGKNPGRLGLYDSALAVEVTTNKTIASSQQTIDTNNTLPGAVGKKFLSVVADEEISLAENDTLQIKVLCAADSTGDTDVLYDKTYTAGSGGATIAAGTELVGNRSSASAAYTYGFSDFTLPDTATRYIGIQIGANNASGGATVAGTKATAALISDFRTNL